MEVGNRTILFAVQSLDRDAKWEYEISKDRRLLEYGEVANGDQ